MKIRDALPHVFNRAYPVLDPKMPMLPAVSMLRFQEIDGLPLVIDTSASRPRALHGYSLLRRLLALGQGGFWKFIERPCEDAAQSIGSVWADESLEKLFDVFLKERFGFAWIADTEKTGVPVSLADIIELYRTGLIESDLQVKDVGSPIFALPGMTPLRKALLFMFSHRFRRVFLSVGGTFVSDRSIISHVFSPAVLHDLAANPDALLEIPIAEVEKTKSKRVPGRTTLKAAANTLGGDIGQCLTSRGAVITPWDIVMKPWEAKRLTING
ncbi:MAG: CBS domain-containing protein [Nitrososphaerota archaeon]|nr:CBS domain-containing protein [Nitrososphaerota archaeon]MDG6967147.1 CBS domain-containing protein [Nitrososphaerota archaeon]MDG6978070.1 CBS domain-containing protein [Nitrososphaerota archaeon]